MFQLAIKTTQSVSTDDLEIYVGDAPLVFEAVGNISNSLHTDLLKWSKADYPAAQTAGFIPRLFLSVSQNGETYPLTSQAEAEALRTAVGDDLLRDIVEGYWDFRYRFFRQKRAGSGASLPALNTGSESDTQP